MSPKPGQLWKWTRAGAFKGERDEFVVLLLEHHSGMAWKTWLVSDTMVAHNDTLQAGLRSIWDLAVGGWALFSDCPDSSP